MTTRTPAPSANPASDFATAFPNSRKVCVEHALARAQAVLPSVADNNPHVHWRKRKSDTPVEPGKFVDRRGR